MTGSDFSLQPKAGAPQPYPVQSVQPKASKVKPPQYIDVNTTEDAVNNVIAQGVQQSDQRYQVKQLDRAGMSRGRGQDYMAAQAGQQAAGQAATQAAELRAGDDNTNAQMRADFENMQAQEAQARRMAAHAKSQAGWSVNFAKQQAAMDLLKQALLGGASGWKTIMTSGGGKITKAAK